MAYTKRYPAGFVDLPTKTTALDAQFANAVEAALLELLSTDGTVDGQALQWIAANSKFGPALLLNKNIDPAAAIDKSKLNLAGQIANADISGAAAIDRSKLNFGAGLVNADIAAAAAIVLSKLAGYPADATKFARGDGTWSAATASGPSARVYNSVGQTLGSGAFAPLVFDSEMFDASNMHSTSVNTSRITIATPGIYLVTGQIWFPTGATGTQRIARVWKNGAIVSPISIELRDDVLQAVDVQIISVCGPVSCVATDYIELAGFQDTGGNITINASSWLSAVQIA